MTTDLKTQSLRLEINDFRAWSNFVIELKPGEVTLLQGASGSGKSTIIRALMWVLFGKERLVAPIDKPNAKTLVKLSVPVNLQGEWRLLEIIRRKNPTNVRARLDGDKWATDVEGQALISACMVGSTDPDAYQGWLAGAYLGRAGGNSFIQGSTAEKMAILDRLAFAGDKPHQVLDKLKGRVRDTKASVQRRQAVYDHEREQLGESPEKVSLDKLGKAESLKQKATEALTEARVRQLELTRADQERTSLETELAKAQKPLAKPSATPLTPEVSWFSPDHCDCWSDGVGCDLDGCLSFLRRLSSIKTRDSLTRTLASMTEPTEGPCLSDDLLEAQRQRHAEVAYAQQTLARYGLDYSGEAVQLRLDEISETLRQHQVGVQYQELDALVSVPEPDPVPLPTAVAPEAKYGVLKEGKETNDVALARALATEQELKADLVRREAEPDTVNCPKCEATLVITDSKSLTEAADGLGGKAAALAEIKSKLETNQEALKVAQYRDQLIKKKIAEITQAHQKAMTEYTRLLRSQELKHSRYLADCERVQTENLAIESKRQAIEAKLDGQPRESVLPKSKIQALTHEQADLRRLTLPLVYSVYDLETVRCRWHETSRLLAELDLPDHPLSECQRVLTWLESRKKAETQYRRLVSEQEHRVEALTERLAKVPIVEPYPRTESYLLERISFADSTVQARARYAEWLGRRKKVIELKKQATEASDNFRRVSQLHKIAVQTESALVEEVAEHLNLDMSEYCPRLFPDTDTVAKLQLSKVAKTSEARQYRPEIVIDHRGNQNVKLSSLSDGEGDRVSIAFVLAMSYISGTPIIILDESLASLNSEYKHEAVELIRERGPRFSLVVMHDGVSGIFDRVIDLSESKD